MSDPALATRLGAEIRESLAAFPADAPGVAPRRLGDLAWDLYALVGRSYAADPRSRRSGAPPSTPSSRPPSATR